MDLEQITQFLKVAEVGSFTRAAELVGLSQSALSRSIQRLEEELGKPLFERQGRTLSLTDAGLLFQTRGTQVLAIIEDTKSELGDDTHTGRVRIGAIPTIAPYFLPELLRKFSQECPKASMLVHEEVTDQLLKRVRQGETDVAVVALPIPDRYLEVEPLFDEELWLVIPNQHPLADQAEIRVPDIKSYPFVLLDEAHCLSDQITSYCRQKSFQPVAVERTSQLAMVQELVSLGHGISLIPEMARRVDRGRTRTYKSFTKNIPTRTIAAVVNPYRFESGLIKRFRQRLREYSQEVAAACRA